MKGIRALTILALSALVSHYGYATDVGPGPLLTYRQADAATRTLVRKVIDGMGGEKRLAELSGIEKSCSIDQRVPKPIHVDFDGIMKFPDGLFATITLPSKRLTAVRVGDSAFVYRSDAPIAGSALKLNEGERRTLSGFFLSHPLAVLQNQINAQYRFGVAGERTINGRAMDLLVIRAEGYDIVWYVDRETGLVYRTEFDDRVTDFSDWRNVDGLVLPFHETVTRNSEVESRTAVRSFKVNPHVNPAVFSPPKFWEQRYNLPARDEFHRYYRVYYFYWLYY